MNDRNRLESMADDELLAALSRITRKSNETTAEFLAHLAELDTRKLFLDLGFSSLFEYCTVSLGLSESAAGRRTLAARVCRQYPEGLVLVASGALHLSALCSLKPHLTSENAPELFALCSHKSARKAEEALAARFPKPDVRDLIRRLPTSERLAPDVGSEADGAHVGSAEAPPQSTNRAQHDGLEPGAGANDPPGPPPSETRASTSPSPSDEATQLRISRSQPPARIEPRGAGRFGVHFTADLEFRELLERVRGLAAHRLPNGDLLTLLKHGLELYERELEKQRFGVGRKPRAFRASPPNEAERRSRSQLVDFPTISANRTAKPGVTAQEVPVAVPPAKTKRGRHCSAAVAREVFTRDGKRCTYVSGDGQRCTAQHFLELDHIKPWALGGDETTGNLRLRCRAHNQRHAQHCFGAGQIEAARARAKQRRNERIPSRAR